MKKSSYDISYSQIIILRKMIECQERLITEIYNSHCVMSDTQTEFYKICCDTFISNVEQVNKLLSIGEEND